MDKTDPMIQELSDMLARSGGRLSEVYSVWISGVVKPGEIAESGAAANSGAAGHSVAVIKAVLEGEMPSSSTVARQAAGSISRMMRSSRELTPAARELLAARRAALLDISHSSIALEITERALNSTSDCLEPVVQQRSGVYVFTYPHYYKYPFHDDGSERILLKVGSSTRHCWTRVKEQARAAGSPEEPRLLRMYPCADPRHNERIFHRLLEAADHERVGRPGKEWFVTSLTFLDEVARALGLDMLTVD